MVESRGRILTVTEAERLLRGGAAGIPALVLATGEEAWLRDRLVAAFRTGGAAEGAEVRRLEGDEISAEDLEGALQAVPLFGGGVRLWIREVSKLGKAPLDALLAWAGTPPEGVRALATTARDPGELKSLEALAARGALVSCSLRAADRAAWAKRMVKEAGLELPPELEAAVLAAPSLLAAAQELEKLAALAGEKGRVPGSAARSLRGSMTEGSLERWVDALLAGDRAAVRHESAALAAAGGGGTSALWALAERALGSLEPGGFGWPRRPASRPMPPGLARRVLDAVYHADRSLKRGELTDEDLMDALALAVEGALRAGGKERIAS